MLFAAGAAVQPAAQPAAQPSLSRCRACRRKKPWREKLLRAAVLAKCECVLRRPSAQASPPSRPRQTKARRQRSRLVTVRAHAALLHDFNVVVQRLHVPLLGLVAPSAERVPGCAGRNFPRADLRLLFKPPGPHHVRIAEVRDAILLAGDEVEDDRGREPEEDGPRPELLRKER